MKLRELHPAAGILTAVGLAAAAAAAPGRWAGPGCVALIAGLWVASRAPSVRLLMRATALVATFFVWTALGIIFAAALFPAIVPDAADSLQRTISLALRSLAALWALHGAAGASDVGELMAAGRQLGLPARVVSVLFIAYRHAHVYARRIGAVRAAMVVRSAGRRVPAAAVARAAGQFLVQASEQADVMALALVARGFSGDLPTRRLPRPPVGQLLGAAGMVALTVALCWAAGRCWPW